MSHDRWPELPWRAWGDSLATLHMWTQIVGKLRMAATPPSSHWWHAPLSVTPRGLTTSAIPYGARLFQIDIDLVDHALLVTDSEGRSARLDLAAKPVAQFYREVLGALRALDIELSILARPVEVVDAIPFDKDFTHTTYDRAHVAAFHGALVQAYRLLASFRATFVGKASPVHYFWGSFDLTTTRFSGRRAPMHPGGRSCGRRRASGSTRSIRGSSRRRSWARPTAPRWSRSRRWAGSARRRKSPRRSPSSRAQLPRSSPVRSWSSTEATSRAEARTCSDRSGIGGRAPATRR